VDVCSCRCSTSRSGKRGRAGSLSTRNLPTHALATHHLPERLVDFLSEDKVPKSNRSFGELVGLHPSLWELEQRVSETIMQLSYLGRVVIVGRAAYLVTRPLPGGFHVPVSPRLPRWRIQRVMQHAAM